MNSNRRKFLQYAITTLASTSNLGFASAIKPNSLDAKLASTWLDEEHKATLPVGASLRIVARSGERPAEKSDYKWHGAPDGGACYETEDKGWIYVSNSELSDDRGGVGALRFNAKAELTDAYAILENTSRNCAGGRSLWNTWLSCEEYGDKGQVYECDPFGKKPSKVLPAMGSFNHEAVALDPKTGYAYLTEDVSDGCLYRFVPKKAGSLEEGELQVAVRKESFGDEILLTWQLVKDPSATKLPTRYQVAEAARFKGGEGIVYSKGSVFFTTKKDNRVWALELESGKLTMVYDASMHLKPELTGVDNIEVTPSGEFLVAEDGGDMQIVALTAAGNVVPLVKLHGQDESEITGPAFSPDGSKLYFSSQRGFGGKSKTGLTYELSLPWMASLS